MKVIIFLGGLILTNLVQAATLTASVDRNKIRVNETLALKLRYNDQADEDELDLSMLDQDFDVLGVRHQTSSSLTVIQGKSTSEILTVWNITLAPKREGTLVIPSFNVDGNISNAIRIDAMQASANITQEEPMIVRLSSDTKTAYPDQQILIKTEYLVQSSVDRPSAPYLKLDNVELELLDEKNYRKVENGISWSLTERIYAVFPKQVGELRIPKQLIYGNIALPNQRNRFGLSSPRGQQISRSSNSLTITVKEKLETNGLNWFPANDVIIESSWSGDTSQMRVGEPITRIVQIIANGQRASVIPPLPQNSSVTYKSYEDQAQLENRPTPTGLVGIRQESEAIVPSAEGILELPEKRITWWNTRSNSWEEAVLPAETFEVLPAIQNTSFAPPSGAPQFLPEQQGGTVTIVEATNIWWKVTTAILALICLLQFWLLARREPAPTKSDSSSSQDNPSEAKAWKALQKALKSADHRAIRSSLLSWSQTAIPDQRIPSLQSLINYLGDSASKELRIQLNKLDESLYRDGTDLDIGVLTQVLSNLKSDLQARKSKPDNSADLAPLYPT